MEQNPQQNPLKKVMIVLIVVAVALAGALAYVWYQQSTLVKELTLDKENIPLDCQRLDPREVSRNVFTKVKQQQKAVVVNVNTVRKWLQQPQAVLHRSQP